MSEHLRALALAATPGPWLKEGHTIYALVHFGWRNGVEQFKNRFWASVYKDVECPEEERQANVDFIAAANPAAILALLDELADHGKAYELLFKENAELRKDADRYCWLCQQRIVPSPSLWDNGVGFWCNLKGLVRSGTTVKNQLDAAIDAAKGESNE